MSETKKRSGDTIYTIENVVVLPPCHTISNFVHATTPEGFSISTTVFYLVQTHPKSNRIKIKFMSSILRTQYMNISSVIFNEINEGRLKFPRTLSYHMYHISQVIG